MHLVEGHRPARRGRLAAKLVVAAMALSLTAAVVYAYASRNVHRVSVAPGETVHLTVELPMARVGGPKSFAKELGLPVSCRVRRSEPGPDGVSVSVVETGHKIHVMWARLRVVAEPRARPGRRRRHLEFTIADEGGWPEATVVVRVSR